MKFGDEISFPNHAPKTWKPPFFLKNRWIVDPPIFQNIRVFRVFWIEVGDTIAAG